jgi:hypothetical protein
VSRFSGAQYQQPRAVRREPAGCAFFPIPKQLRFSMNKTSQVHGVKRCSVCAARRVIGPPSGSRKEGEGVPPLPAAIVGLCAQLYTSLAWVAMI